MAERFSKAFSSLGPVAITHTKRLHVRGYRDVVRRVLLVANPSASGFTGGRFREVRSILGMAYEVTPVWPSGPTEAQDCATKAADDGFYAVLAMGGDGVVHHVANGLVHSQTALGIVPAGTTNVLARLLGIPMSAKKAASALTRASLQPLPVAHVATDSRTGARAEYATFAAGIGFDAEVVAKAEQRPYSKVHFGSFHYAGMIAAKIFRGYGKKPQNLRIECAGERVDAQAVFVAVHSAYSYFGKMPLRFAAADVAGLTAVAVEELTPRRATDITLRALTGRSLRKVPGVHVWSDFEKLVIEADPPSSFQADGELLGAADAIEVSPGSGLLLALTPS